MFYTLYTVKHECEFTVVQTRGVPYIIRYSPTVVYTIYYRNFSLCKKIANA